MIHFLKKPLFKVQKYYNTYIYRSDNKQCSQLIFELYCQNINCPQYTSHTFMNKQQPQSFSIKCQCSAYKNGLLITTKKKSKLSNLLLNLHQKTITIIPLNSKDQNIIFQIRRLKHIHRKFISQGKITLEFSQDIEKSSSIVKIPVQQVKTERLSQIFVEAASAQNLELLIGKIVTLKKEMKPESKSLKKEETKSEKDYMTEDEGKGGSTKPQLTSAKKKQNFPKIERFTQNMVQRKRDPLRYNQGIKQYEQEQKAKPHLGLSRKQLMKQALNPHLYIQKPHQPKPIFRPEVQLLQLPSILLQKIFQFTHVSLSHRLISKKFDRFVLRNLLSLTFKDEVDQMTFNKLAKYAINVRGRLKNVRNFQLIDLHDDRELEKNKAKSFYLGQWKQMSRKNMLQLKGLRIHTLQMPYIIKFQFQSIYGIRLKQLHLYSRQQVTTQNSLISDQNLLYIFKHVKELQAFSIPYINSSVLEELATGLKEKAGQMKVLRVGSVNQNCKGEESWFLLHIYEQLKCFAVDRVLKGGIPRRDVRHKFTFPLFLQQLSLGSIVSSQTIHSFPTTLTRLKLSGEQYYNNDIASIYLPYLKTLDLSECQLVRPALVELLEKCTGLRMITNWDRQDVDYWREVAAGKDVEIVTVKGMIRR